MSRFRQLACLSLIVIALALPSCIDGREELWINADGSGRADFRYELPANAARFQGGEQGVRDLLTSVLKNLKSSHQEIVTEGDRMKIHVTAGFDHITEITSLASSSGENKMPSSFQHLAGIFQFSRSFRTIDFTRSISPGKALPTAFIPAAELKNRKLTYIIHLPVVPTESNATQVSDGGKTLTWEQTLSSAIRQPVIIHLKAKIPIPGWIIAALAGVAALLIALIIAIIKRRRRRAFT